MLRADFDAFGLKNLTDVEERLEIFGLRVLAQHVLAYKLVAARVLLMCHHDRRLYVSVRRHSVSGDRFELREGLKAELAHEARGLFLVN